MTVTQNITGADAKRILQDWGIQPERRWVALFHHNDYDDQEVFAYYEDACPHPGCGASLLTGWGGSGDASDETQIICKHGHISYDAPDGGFRPQREVENDCWEHHHNGPEPCPDPEHQEEEPVYD